MEYKLLLTSSGIVPEIKRDFLTLLQKKPEECKVAFVTTAVDNINKAATLLQRNRDFLYACNIHQIENTDIREKTKEDIEKILVGKDIVYVNGGSTFYLLRWARESGFNQVITEYVQRGGLYVGVSAGSYITCPTIEMATWKRPELEREGITDFTALNLVPFLITAHFEEKYRVMVEQGAKNTAYPVVAITDQQAILIKGKKCQVIGKGKKEFWNGFQETDYQRH